MESKDFIPILIKLLAQLNFAQLPAPSGFPTGGILQFFVLPDDAAGMNDYPQTKQSTFRVIYHKEVLSESDHMADFPEITWIAGHDGTDYAEELYPIKGEFALTGELSSYFMPFSTHEFDGAFAAFCERQGIKSDFGPYFAEVPDDMTKDEYKEFDRRQRKLQDLIWREFSGDEAHRFGGWPYFIQHDPRDWDRGDPAWKKYDTLLLAITSEYNNDKSDIRVISDSDEIMWGDAGVANFLINAEDLKNLDFSDIMYVWDSC